MLKIIKKIIKSLLVILLLLSACALIYSTYKYQQNKNIFESENQQKLEYEKISSIVESACKQYKLKHDKTDISREYNKDKRIAVQIEHISNLDLEKISYIGEDIDNKLQEMYSPQKIEFLIVEGTKEYTFSKGRVYENNRLVFDEYNYDKFPSVGMGEEELYSTILGVPNKIEPCRDYKALEARRKYKDYYWNENQCHVRVQYRRYYGHNCDDYVDYDDNRGYVYEVSYITPEGFMHTEKYEND